MNEDREQTSNDCHRKFFDFASRDKLQSSVERSTTWKTNDLSFSLSYIITTIVRRTRYKLAYKNGRPGLKCLRISLNAFYKLSDSTMSETTVIDVLSHGTMFFAHIFIDSTTLRTKVNCVYVWNCDANTLCSTEGAFHVLFYRWYDVLHYQTYAASTTVSIIGLPSNATAVTVTTSLLPLSFLICCRVPVSLSYSPHVSIHWRGMDAMMLLDRLMS